MGGCGHCALRPPLHASRTCPHSGACAAGGWRQQVTLHTGATGTCPRRGPRHSRGGGGEARPTPATRSPRPRLHRGIVGGVGVKSGEDRDVALPKSKISLPRFHRSRPRRSCQGWRRGQGRSHRRGGIFGRCGGRVRKNNSRLPLPLGDAFAQPIIQTSRARAQHAQLERIWAKEEKGAPNPSLASLRRPL